ncbi:MAG TPA: hydroxyethylthiazole kinase [Virgibacillus sp.]|nr:hydroxyethylthiazole kinase [Virgibacillus sp.]
MNEQVITEVRQHKPLVHHLTNQVVMNFSANGLLSFGGSPVMTAAEEEAQDMALHANAILINIGTVTPTQLKAMIQAGKAANEQNIPVVLDPVGVAATPFRQQAVQQILKEVKPTLIKGNAGEMAHLVHLPWETKGVESIGSGNQEEIAMKTSEMYDTAAVVTGKTDVSFINGGIHFNNIGSSHLANVTGAGCLLGSILAACLSTQGSLEEQVQTGVAFYGAAAAYAAKDTTVTGTGTFTAKFIDALSLDRNQLKERKNG